EPDGNRNSSHDPSQSSEAIEPCLLASSTWTPARYCAAPFENSTRTGYSAQRGSSLPDPIPVQTASTPLMGTGVSIGIESAKLHDADASTATSPIPTLFILSLS